MTHTPGPWTRKLSAMSKCWKISGPGWWDLAKVANQESMHSAGVYDANAGEANARLICAAPDMLEALKAFQAMIDDTDDETLADIAVELMESAIDKAEGR